MSPTAKRPPEAAARASEISPETLKREYLQMALRFPTVAVLPKQESVFRKEQTEQVLGRMENGETIIVSGIHGCGKSSFLNQLEGLALEQGIPVINIDRHGLTYGADAMHSQLLRHGEKIGIKAADLTEMVKRMKERGAILLVDEYTYLLDPALTERQRENFAPLAELVSIARDEGIPTAVVIHAIPPILNNAFEQLSLDAVHAIVPNPATEQETEIAVTHGSIHPRGESPKEPEVVKIDPETAKTVRLVAGSQPAIINQLMYTICFTEEGSTYPAPAITPSKILDLWKSDEGERLLESRTVEWRILKLTKLHFMKNEDELNLFRRTFDLPVENDHRNVTELKQVDADKIPAELKDRWLRLGLIREEDNKVCVDGLVIAAYVSSDRLP